MEGGEGSEKLRMSPDKLAWAWELVDRLGE